MSGITKYTKSTIIAALRKIRSDGWIKSCRNVHNDGAIGNTLEDLLGISENNLPLPNAAEWELKTQRKNTSALLTLFHLEPSCIDDELTDWKNDLIAQNRIKYDNDYLPYWGFHDVYHKAGIKLGNCFYVLAEVKKEGEDYFYRYSDIMQMSGFTLDEFLSNITDGNILIDFDARTSHNHGTKFRIKQNAIPLLYKDVIYI